MAKNKKLEETFEQLDAVFSCDDQADNEDFNVADELKRISQGNLNQIFEMQKEIADLKALENIPHQLARLLRKSQEKTVKSPNGKHQAQVISMNDGSDQFVSLEDQVMDLNFRL